MGRNHLRDRILSSVSGFFVCLFFFFLSDMGKDTMNYSGTPLCEASCTKTDNLIQIMILKLLVIYFIHALYSQ